MGVNLAKLIQDKWAADTTLNALLPATKVMVGTYFAADPTYPYGTITLPGGAPGARANDGSSEAVITVVVAIYHDHGQYNACKAIADRVQSLFQDNHFDLAASNRCVHIRSGQPQEIQDQETGEWTFVVSLECRAYLAAGV